MIAPVSEPVIQEVNLVYSLQKLYACNVSGDAIDEYNGSIVVLPVPIASKQRIGAFKIQTCVIFILCTHPALAVSRVKTRTINSV